MIINDGIFVDSKLILKQQKSNKIKKIQQVEVEKYISNAGHK